jgi:hypothetical protein
MASVPDMQLAVPGLLRDNDLSLVHGKSVIDCHLVIIVEMVVLDVLYEFLGILRIGGIATFLQTVCPGLVVGDIVLEQGLVAVLVAEEIGMVPEGLLRAVIDPETLSAHIVIDFHGLALPVVVTLDPEMVVTFRGQGGKARTRLKDTLCQGDAGRYSCPVHLTDRDAGICGNILLLRVVP